MGTIGCFNWASGCDCLICEESFDEFVYWREGLRNLARCLDVAAGLAAVHQLAYHKGFGDGRLCRDFCEPNVCESYSPLADSRPTADRLAWAREL